MSADANPAPAPLRHRIGLILGPLVFLALLAAPLPDLTPPQHRLTAVMALVIIFWVTEAIPLAATAFLGPVLAVLLGVAEDKKIYAPFGSPTILHFIGTFMLAAAMEKFHLDRRLALRLLSVPALARTPFRLFAALGLLTAALSMWMSNTATTAMMLPIALASAQAWPGLRDHPGSRAGLVLLIAFSASVGGQGTPVGTPPNLIGLGAIRETLGVQISFLKWMALGVPLVIIQTFFLIWLLRPAPTAVANDEARALLAEQHRQLGSLSRGERVVITVFLLAVIFWIVPGIFDATLGSSHPLCRFFRTHLPEETVGLLAGVSLLAIPLSWRRGEFALTWREAVRIDWGTIFLFAGGMALGAQLFQTGLAEKLGRGLVGGLGAAPGLWTLVAAGIIFSLILSETASNTASATVMVPVMIAIAQGANVPPLPVALASCLACSFGFMLPVSTGPNAMAYGTGLVPLTTMVRKGFFLDVCGAITIFLVIRIVTPLLGWA